MTPRYQYLPNKQVEPTSELAFTKKRKDTANVRGEEDEDDPNKLCPFDTGKPMSTTVATMTTLDGGTGQYGCLWRWGHGAEQWYG